MQLSFRTSVSLENVTDNEIDLPPEASAGLVKQNTEQPGDARFDPGHSYGP